MGNRAVLDMDGKTGIYLHWNGDPISIASFLKVADDYQLRTDDYGIARFTQIIGNWFGGALSIGIGTLEDLDGMQDKNQAYVIRNWEVYTGISVDSDSEMVAKIHSINDPIFLKEGA
jgi:hypothetical protein